MQSAAPGKSAKRRIPVTSSTHVTPFQTCVGSSGTTEQLEAIFQQYGYLTVSMVAKILNKTENTARNKLNKLVASNTLETLSLPRSSPGGSGKTPTVYTLKVKKGVRKHEFMEHALATSDILIHSALLPTIANVTLLHMQSDYTLKTSPIKLPNGLVIPDGIVRLASQEYEYIVYYEIDRNTEFQKEKITSKLNNYKELASQCDCMVVAFCVTEGGDLRVKTLKNWAQEIVPVELRELFLFSPIDLETLTPEKLYQTPIWSSLSSSSLTALLEP